MNYPEALSYLSRIGDEVLGMKFGLETIRRLLQALGDPHRDYPSVLIAGTNGKGSVARFLSGICTTSGIRNGLFTSPHLIRPEERFAVNQEAIGPEIFARYLTRVVEAIHTLNLEQHPTYFETLTALAFTYFREQKIDLAVLEVGMGGRLDSTNVVDPMLSILTTIGMDHQKFLGNTMEEIAREKAGILHRGGIAVVAPQRSAARDVFLKEASARNVTLHALDCDSIDCSGAEQGRYRFRYHGEEFQLRVCGKKQVENAALAIRGAELLTDQGFCIPSRFLKEGIERTQLPGRIQRIEGDPLLILDGAHNIDAAQNLAEFLTEHTEAPRSLVFGMMRDKDIREVIAVLRSCFDRIYLTRVNSKRAATIDDLRSILPSGVPVLAPYEALEKARLGCQTAVVAGSFYLVGEILTEMPVTATPQ